MTKQYINFRKRYLLPWKWMVSRKKMIANTRLVDVKTVIELKEKIEEDLIKSQRLELGGEIAKAKVKLNLLSKIIIK